MLHEDRDRLTRRSILAEAGDRLHQVSWGLEGSEMKGSHVIDSLVERAHRLRAPHWWGIRPFRRHSLVLMVAGGVYILIGLTMVLTEPSEGRAVALYMPLHWTPQELWGLVWATAGAMAVISSRWPPVSETWGYIVLTGLSAGWSAFYFVNIVFGPSTVANFSQVFSWGLIAFLWWAISGLLNPADKTALPMHDDGG